MTPEILETLRLLSHCGDRDAQLTTRAGDIADLIDELDAATRLVAIALVREPGQFSNARAILGLAMTIGQHWRDQEGVSGALLDQLAELTK